jgi:hypothetical protein
MQMKEKMILGEELNELDGNDSHAVTIHVGYA